MIVLGAEILGRLASGELSEAKMVFNQRGAVIFGAGRQHRDVKAEGLSYEDNYAGDALAAMVRPGELEIRFHQRFSDRDVARIVGQLSAIAALSQLKEYRVSYQGRAIGTPPSSGAHEEL